MSQTATPNLGLLKAFYQDVRWDTSYEELFDNLDEALTGWVRYGYINPPATGVANNQFQINGDVAALFPVGRKVRAHLSGSQVIVTVSSASYGANVTTVTVNETSIDGTLTDIWVCVFDILYASAATFTVAGDKTLLFVAGLALKVQLAASTVYTTVISSSYNGGTGLTTVTVGSVLTNPIWVLWISPVRPVAAADRNLPADLGVPGGQIFGLKLGNGDGAGGGDLTNDITIAAGEAVSDDVAMANRVNMVLGSAITKRLDAAWAVGSGNGGLDTGSIGNGTYHLFEIMRTDTGVVDVLFSLSPTAPTMPANYTKKRRIGSIIRVSAAIVLFTQNDDEFLLAVPVRDINVTNPGTAAVLYTLTVPTGLKVKALLDWYSSGTTGVNILITSPDQADTAPTSSCFTFSMGANQPNCAPVERRVNTSGQIRFRSSGSDANLAIFEITRGWIDGRGRDM